MSTKDVTRKKATEKNNSRKNDHLKIPDDPEIRKLDKKVKENLAQVIKSKSLRELQRIIFGRTVVIVLLLLIQAFFFIYLVAYMKDKAYIIYAICQVLAIFVLIAIENNRSNPMFKITWIVLVLLLPVFGAGIYVYTQVDLGHKKMTKRVREMNRYARPYQKQDQEVAGRLKYASPRMYGMSKYIYRSCGCPTYDHSNVKYFPLGEDYFRDLLIQIKQAKHFIFMEYFIITGGYMWGMILSLLCEKAKEGVEIRIMYDGLCTLTNVPVSYPKILESMGIHCKVVEPLRPIFATVQNNRDHRKIAVIDGKVAFTGGINLADEYINVKERFGHWKDTGVMITGQAVRSFTTMFLSMWNIDEKEPEDFSKYLLHPSKFANVMTDGYMMPYGDCPFNDYYVAKHIYLDLINTSTKYVHIMTPYLVLDNETLEALTFAADRGVEVTLLLPHIPDKKFVFYLAKNYYDELLDSGVRIYEYTPGFVHAKVFISDDTKAVVGSSNLDFRSFYLHYECGLAMYRCSEIQNIEKDFEKTLSASCRVTEHAKKRDSFWVRAAGELLRIVAPLL